MKVLINAYACEPNRGSEPGVGWHWAEELSKDSSKEVHILTRANNQKIIDAYFEKTLRPKNLHFHYYDLPSCLIWAKHHGLPVNIYYALWLYGAGNYAKRLNKIKHFDIAHHLTFGVFRDAPFLHKLDIPYVIGPIGGGEYTPRSLSSIYTSFKTRLTEQLRFYINKLAIINPFYYKAYNKAFLILTKTDETKSALGYNDIKKKAITRLEIGIAHIHIDKTQERDKHTFIFVGRFLSWKGVELILRAFKDYHFLHDKMSRLILIGKGDQENRILEFSQEYNLTSYIKIIDWIKQEELQQYYLTSALMIFPSLHDSSGNAVLEALSCGLPVITLDCGGPACVLGKNLEELVVKINNNGVDKVASDIASKMQNIISDEQKYQSLSEKCLERAKDLLWSNTVHSTYKLIEEKLLNEKST